MDAGSVSSASSRSVAARAMRQFCSSIGQLGEVDERRQVARIVGQHALERLRRPALVGQLLRVDHAQAEEDLLQDVGGALELAARDERLGGLGPLAALEGDVGERGDRGDVVRIAGEDGAQVRLGALGVAEIFAVERGQLLVQLDEALRMGLDGDPRREEIGEVGVAALARVEIAEAAERVLVAWVEREHVAERVDRAIGIAASVERAVLRDRRVHRGDAGEVQEAHAILVAARGLGLALAGIDDVAPAAGEERGPPPGAQRGREAGAGVGGGAEANHGVVGAAEVDEDLAGAGQERRVGARVGRKVAGDLFFQADEVFQPLGVAGARFQAEERDARRRDDGEGVAEIDQRRGVVAERVVDAGALEDHGERVAGVAGERGRELLVNDGEVGRASFGEIAPLEGAERGDPRRIEGRRGLPCEQRRGRVAAQIAVDAGQLLVGRDLAGDVPFRLGALEIGEGEVGEG